MDQLILLIVDTVTTGCRQISGIDIYDIYKCENIESIKEHITDVKVSKPSELHNKVYGITTKLYDGAEDGILRKNVKTDGLPEFIIDSINYHTCKLLPCLFNQPTQPSHP